MRGMIGGKCIDNAVINGLLKRLDIFLSPQRRIDFEIGIIIGNRLLRSKADDAA